LRWGYVGSRRGFEALRSVLIGRLEYVDEPSDVVKYDVVISDMEDPPVAAYRVRCFEKPCVLSTLVEILNSMGNVVVGVDLGTSNNGVAVLYNGSPTACARLSRSELNEFFERVKGIVLAVGYSPYVDLWEFIDRVRGRCREIHVIDELKVISRRFWLESRYPHLTEDEVDAIVFAIAAIFRNVIYSLRT